MVQSKLTVRLRREQGSKQDKAAPIDREALKDEDTREKLQLHFKNAWEERRKERNQERDSGEKEWKAFQSACIAASSTVPEQNKRTRNKWITEKAEQICAKKNASWKRWQHMKRTLLNDILKEIVRRWRMLKRPIDVGAHQHSPDAPQRPAEAEVNQCPADPGAIIQCSADPEQDDEGMEKRPADPVAEIQQSPVDAGQGGAPPDSWRGTTTKTDPPYIKKGNTKSLWKATLTEENNYRTLKRLATASASEDKEIDYTKKVEILEEYAKCNEYRKVWQTIKQWCWPRVKEVPSITNKEGVLLDTKPERAEGWREFFDGVYNVAKEVNLAERTERLREIIGQDLGVKPTLTALTATERTQMAKAPSQDEIKKGIAKLKNNKAPGESQVVAEILKNAGEAGREWLTEVVEKCWNEGIVPQQWRDAVIVPLWKQKGSSTDCNKYRGIALLEVAGKVLTAILSDRFQLIMTNRLKDSQWGFRAHRSTREPLALLRRIIDAICEGRSEVYATFIDLEKAYDKVPRNMLKAVLLEIGFPAEMVEIVDSFHTNTSYAVKAEGQLGGKFGTFGGVRQGCKMAPVLFNIYIDIVMRDILDQAKMSGIEVTSKENGGLWDEDKGWATTTIRDLMFADDAAIFTKNGAQMQQLMQIVDDTFSAWGMPLSVEKTEIMQIGRKRRAPEEIELRAKKLEQATNFKYLGGTCNKKGSTATEANQRVGKFKGKVNAMRRRIWRRKDLSTKLKRRFYNVACRSGLTYGAESLILTKKQAQKWERAQNNTIRSILRVPLKAKTTNEELRKRVGLPTIASYMRGSRLKFDGHMCRTDETHGDQYGVIFGTARHPEVDKSKMSHIAREDINILLDNWRNNHNWGDFIYGETADKRIENICSTTVPNTCNVSDCRDIMYQRDLWNDICCGVYSFKCQHDHEEHLRRHRNPDQFEFPCPVCGEKFEKQRGLNCHLAKKHRPTVLPEIPEENNLEPVEQYVKDKNSRKHPIQGSKCPECNRQFGNKVKCQNHWNRMHKPKEEPRGGNRQPSITDFFRRVGNT